jgi:hypothetical protein
MGKRGSASDVLLIDEEACGAWTDLKPAAVIEAIFVYDAAMRDKMLPRKSLPRPETFDQQRQSLKGLMSGAVSQ